MNDNYTDITELLAVRATEGLSSVQADRLQEMLDAQGLADTDDFDLAAAAAANAFGLEHASAVDSVPALLKARLRRDANQFFGQSQDSIARLPRPVRHRGYWGWAAAAALAAILLATNVLRVDTSTDFAADRDVLIADVEGTAVIPWQTPDDPEFAGVSGNVAWNDERQEGYMLLTGMPVNDPATAQYQLWLVDTDRYAYPVDGGVFDIPLDGSPVVIPIDAKLRVNEPTVFAITREQPGGVVVSEGPLLVVASSG